MFEKADNLFYKLGYNKVEDNEYIVTYDCCRDEGTYNQRICIVHKSGINGGKDYCIVQSYDSELFDEKKIGNTCIGMTTKELKASLKKIKEKKWN